MYSLFKQSVCDRHYELLYPLLSGNTQQEKQQRINVYRNNVHRSLLEALNAIFPKCAQLIGEDIFQTVALAFIKESLPQSPILREYGAQFPAFIDQVELPAHLGCAPLLAALEYELLQLTHAAEESVLSSLQLHALLSQSQSIMEHQWQLSSTVKLWHCPIAIGSLYLTLEQDINTPIYEPDWRKEKYLVLHKQEWFGCCSVVSESTFALLREIKQGHSLAQASQQLEANQLEQALSEFLSLPIIRQIGDTAC